MTSQAPKQWLLTIDYVPGQGWEAAFEGNEPTLGTGGFGWEADDPHTLLRNAATALTIATREIRPGEERL